MCLFYEISVLYYLWNNIEMITTIVVTTTVHILYTKNPTYDSIDFVYVD